MCNYFDPNRFLDLPTFMKRFFQKDLSFFPHYCLLEKLFKEGPSRQQEPSMHPVKVSACNTHYSLEEVMDMILVKYLLVKYSLCLKIFMKLRAIFFCEKPVNKPS